MANKITAPVTNTEVDPSDPVGSLQNVGFGVVGVALALGVFAMGQSLYNKVAESTPDAVAEVEVF